MVKTDPLPCPFCAKEPTVYEGYSGWHVICFGCECGPGTAGHKRKENAVKVWNDRKDTDHAACTPSADGVQAACDIVDSIALNEIPKYRTKV